MVADRMAGRCGGAHGLLAGPIGRGILWVWGVWKDSGRGRVELDYRELKEELGLDHYEGRHWLGWHHHVTLVSMAFAFLRSEQAQAKKNFWCEVDDAAPDSSAASS